LAFIVVLALSAITPTSADAFHGLSRDSFRRDGLMHFNDGNCSGCGEPQIVNITIGPDVTIQICNWPLVPSWMGAFSIGMIGGVVIWRLGPRVVGSRSYAVSYFTYAVMMTSGLVVHCLFTVECENGEQPGLAYLNWAMLDAILTSTIAASFLFNGLIDMGYISEDSKKSWIALGIVFAAIVVGYYAWGNFEVMYMGVILVCCGLYLPIQLYRICTSGTFAGWQYFMLAGLVGGLSFSVVFLNTLACYFCQIFGPWFAESTWYYGADVSMFFMLKYVLASRPTGQGVARGDQGPAYAPVQFVSL